MHDFKIDNSEQPGCMLTDVLALCVHLLTQLVPYHNVNPTNQLPPFAGHLHPLLLMVAYPQLEYQQ